MRALQTVPKYAVSALVLLAASGDARAQSTLFAGPTQGTCDSGTSPATCLKVTENATDGTAVFGQATAGSGYGVFGYGSAYGVKGQGTTGGNATGVYGFGTGTGNGVYGQTTTAGAIGVHGSAPTSGWAGYFDGNVTSTGNATMNTAVIGTMTSPKNYSGYSGFWRNGAPDYSVLTDGFNTFINAPNAGGSIFFRSANTTPSDTAGSHMIIDPDGGVYIKGAFHAIGYDSTVNAAVFGDSSSTIAGVKGTGFGNGVEGTAFAANYSGVYGLAIHANGNGVAGRVSPAAAGNAIYGDNTSASGYAGYFNGQVYAVTNWSSGRAIQAVGNNGAWAGYFNGNVFATGQYMGSDARLKKDIKDMTYGLNQVRQLRPVTYEWKEGEKGTQLGLVAQEVEKIVPEVVRADATSGMLSVNYTALLPVMIRAVQEQQKIIERQNDRIASLEQGRAPALSSIFSGRLGEGVALGLLPLGLVAALRRRRFRL